MSTEKSKVTGYSGHATFTIDDIAAMLPSPARLMHEIGTRWWKVYYAAQASNWALADYEVKQVEDLLEPCTVTQPKYAQYMQPFVNNDINKLRLAITAQDWPGFQQVYHQSIRNANDYHKAAGKALIIWKLPTTPPPVMEMRPMNR